MNKTISLEALKRLVLTPLGVLINRKVDKVAGKGLSTNDYTNEEKEKLANLSAVSMTGDYNDLFNKPEIPSTEGLATELYVDDVVSTKVETAVTNLVNSAPETLDTLGELATAMQENEEVVDALNAAIGNKVDKVDGKDLSTNDYTNEDKEKLGTTVQYIKQSLTESEQIQARKNLDLYYSESEEATIVSESIISSSQSSFAIPSLFVTGEKYTVIWDGIEYQCIAKKYGDYIMLGNNAIYEYDDDINDDTGEPFALETVIGDGECYVYFSDGDTEMHTISIINNKETVHPIPTKYLPEGIGYTTLGEKTIIVDNATITVENTSEPVLDPFAIEITEGIIYEVNWNGTVYECTAYIAEGPNTPSIGNGSSAGASGGNGEPFFITIYEGTVMLFANSAETHTISISSTSVNVHHIPSKYLPPSLDVVTAYVSGYYYNFIELDTEKGASEKELYDAVTSGKQAIIVESVYGNSARLSYIGAIEVEGQTVYCFSGMSYSLSFDADSGRFTQLPCIRTMQLVNDNGRHLLVGNDNLVDFNNVAFKSGTDENDMYVNTTFYYSTLRVADNKRNVFSISINDDQKLSLTNTTDNTSVAIMTEIPVTKEDNGKVVGIVDGKYDLMDVNVPQKSIALIDQVNGYTYILCMREGNLVTYCAAESIEVTTMPDKTEYVNGDQFDPAGMVISATTQDGSNREVSGYKWTPEVLTTDTTVVTISYTERNDTYTVEVPVTVKSKADVLVDFEYTDNGDGTYTITDWKGTYNGEPSTEIIIPDYSWIKV